MPISPSCTTLIDYISTSAETRFSVAPSDVEIGLTTLSATSNTVNTASNEATGVITTGALHANAAIASNRLMSKNPSDGEADALGEIEPDGEIDGLRLPDGLIDGETDGDAEPLGLVDEETEGDALDDGENEAESLALGDCDRLALDDGD